MQPMSFQITYLSSKQSDNIQNEVLTISSEHPSSEYRFERKFQDRIYPSDQRLNNQNKNWYISRENNRWSQTSYQQNTLKIKWSLSLLKLYLMKTSLRLNSRPSLINLIHFKTTRRIIDGFHRTTASRIKTYWRRTDYSQLKNTMPIRSYWSIQWDVIQACITITYY